MPLSLSPDLERRIRDRFAPTFAKATDGMSEVARDSWREVLETSTPSGKLYRDSDTGQKRRASAPGEPPADPDGHLADSIEVVPSRRVRHGHRGAAASDSGIMPILEYGDGPLAPRPSARPAFALAADRLRADLGQVLR